MTKYNEKILKNFANPKNAGALVGANAVSKLKKENQCGINRDVIKFFFKIDDETQTILDARFKTCGCTLAIASANVVCDMVKGKTIEEVLNIKDTDIISVFGEIPFDKAHCLVTVDEAIKSAIESYFEKIEKARKKALK